MAKRKPKVGKTLFLRIRDQNDGRECSVTKVGRKYFSVTKTHPQTQFYISSWSEKTNYMPLYTLYESRQDWEDGCLATKYRRAIEEVFRYAAGFPARITLPQLKQVAEILNIALEDEDKT